MTVATCLPVDEISDGELNDLSAELEAAGPMVILRWALAEFGSNVALATGFGMEGCMLVSMLAEIDVNARMFYLDTDLLFPETYALRDRLAERYKVRFERRATSLTLREQAELFGDRLWEREPNECCRLRKVVPLAAMLSGLQAWITAIRRDQSQARARARAVERDSQFHIIKINPLVNWSAADVSQYVRENDVPYNPLHDAGYPSIGCTPCTTPIQIGEDPRAGRWRGTHKTECGIHRSAN